MLGFREVGSTNSVVVDIGPVASFSSPSTYLINAGSTLSAQYGSGWASNANVFFSLASTSASRTSYMTSAEYSTGPNAGPATIWSRLPNTTSLTLENKINNFGSEFNSVNAATTTPGSPQVEPMSDPNAYANFMPGGTTDAGHVTPANISWGYFNPTSEGDFDQTTAGVKLDLIQLTPGSGPGTDLGVFQLSNNGNTLTYTPNAVVPEPSSYVAMAVFGALTLLGFRMNKARKSSVKEQTA